MPVITAVESGRELAGRRNIGIAAQGVSDFIGIFLMNAGEGQLSKACGGVGVERHASRYMPS